MNHAGGDVEGFGNLSLLHGPVHSANFANIIFGDFAVRVFRSLVSGSRASALLPHVEKIVGLRSCEEMRWPDALGIVAAMERALFLGKWPFQFERKTDTRSEKSL